MTRIATLTMNPTIDASYEVDKVFHTHKMRTRNERYEPGGGGINVARVFTRLGGEATCVYLSGGATGVALDGLLDRQKLEKFRIPIADETRIAAAVLECESGKEFRFTPPGPDVTEAEWQGVLDCLATLECEYFVASGSLSPGVPVDFYARAGAIVRQRGVKFVLDTSGEPLGATIAAGGIHLIKPSLGEMRALTGLPLASNEEIGNAAMRLVNDGKAELVAVTMGHQGALLASANGPSFLPAIEIEARSAVGAGDSFVAGMLHALGNGQDSVDAFAYGVAAGTAAVMAPGHDLAHPADIELFRTAMPPFTR